MSRWRLVLGGDLFSPRFSSLPFYDSFRDELQVFKGFVFTAQDSQPSPLPVWWMNPSVIIVPPEEEEEHDNFQP